MSEQTAWPVATRTNVVGVLVEPGPRGAGRLLATIDDEVLLGRDDACPVLFLSDRVEPAARAPLVLRPRAVRPRGPALPQRDLRQRPAHRA